MNPFEFVNSITFNKNDILEQDELLEKEYAPFLVNRSLSYHQDCILFANEVNRRFDMPHTVSYTHLTLPTTRHV
mgnify:CR=1 FL=1